MIIIHRRTNTSYHCVHWILTELSSLQ